MSNNKYCSLISKFDLVINGNLDEECISFCCYDYSNKPKIKLSNNAKDNVDAFFKLRDIAINELYKNDGCMFSDCLNCSLLTSIEQQKTNLIEFVNLSFYPSPCQCNCIYCDIRKNNKMMKFDNKYLDNYYSLFDTLKFMKEKGYISPKALWQVSCGEISIHPLKKEIIEIVKKENVIFYTNCILFDKNIANILKNNKKAFINFSIDSGTPDTWKKVKGLNNYYKVLDNLKKYIEYSSPEQIYLKYIILPNINNDDKNYYGLVEIMKKIKLTHIILSKNYDSEDDNAEKESLKRIIKILEDNNITYEFAL